MTCIHNIPIILTTMQCHCWEEESGEKRSLVKVTNMHAVLLMHVIIWKVSCSVLHLHWLLNHGFPILEWQTVLTYIWWRNEEVFRADTDNLGGKICMFLHDTLCAKTESDKQSSLSIIIYKKVIHSEIVFIFCKAVRWSIVHFVVWKVT